MSPQKVHRQHADPYAFARLRRLAQEDLPPESHFSLWEPDDTKVREGESAMESRLLIWAGSLVVSVLIFFRCLLVPSRERNLMLNEGRAKFRVMGLVQARTNYFGPTNNLPQLIADIEALDAYAVPWALKGIGKDAVESGMAAKDVFAAACDVHGRRQSRFDPRLMIASGIGMAFARPPIRRAKAEPNPTALKDLADRFHADIETADMGEHIGAAIESLGLCARVMANGRFNRDLAKALLADEPEYYAYYCHGAGRALYFHPMKLFSGRDLVSPAPDHALAEAPTDDGADCMLAGVYWAQTLVGLDCPPMLLWRLATDTSRHGRPSLVAAAMASALVSRLTIDRRSDALDAISRLRPGSDAELQAMEAVVRPALSSAKAVMDGQGGLGVGIGTIYRVSNLEEMEPLGQQFALATG